MNLVSWNAQQKFREKIRYFSPDSFDLLVIQECENTETASELYLEAGWQYVWVGENKHKGLGVFAPLDSTIEQLEWTIDGCRYFLPVQIKHDVVIVAVWAMGGKSKSTSYAGQVTQFLNKYSKKINPKSTLLMGDFNSNTQWDKRHTLSNNTENDKRLNSIGLKSLYHAQEAEENGRERHATFYMYRDIERPYHIDYAYLPSTLIEGSAVEVGSPKKWLQHSDHMPLFVKIARGFGGGS